MSTVQILLQLRSIKTILLQAGNGVHDELNALLARQRLTGLIERRQPGVLRDCKLEGAAVAIRPIVVEPYGLNASAQKQFPKCEVFILVPARGGEGRGSDDNGAVVKKMPDVLGKSNGGFLVQVQQIRLKPCVSHPFAQFGGGFQSLLTKFLVEAQSAGQLAAAIDDVLAVQDAIDPGEHHFDFFAIMACEFRVAWAVKAHGAVF